MIPVLNAKLTPPRSSDATERKRLNPLLDEIPRKALTTVIAGPGYGKSTLVAQACRYLGLDTLWYRLDRSDRDFMAFISYLVAGFQKHYRLGLETLHRAEEADVLQWERMAVLATLLHEVETTVERDLLIVLDDYHTVSDSPEVNESLKFMLDNKPDTLHFVLVSRTDPGLPLSNVRARGDLLEITETDLAFTVDETARLCEHLFAADMEDRNLIVLHQRTRGWVTGLILVYHSLRDKSGMEIQGLLRKLTGSQRFIAAYLGENAYDVQSPEVRELLCKTSILSRLNGDFCDRLLGISDSGAILKSLEDARLFTLATDEEGQWYQYHHLFQEFLQGKLMERGRRTVVDLHRRAARLWEELGWQEDAMLHYLEAHEWSKACHLLSRMGRVKLLSEGRLRLIQSYINEIPEEFTRPDAWIQYMQARTRELSGNPGAAIRAYQAAHSAFISLGLAEEAGLCLKGMGYCYFVMGDFARAETALKQLLGEVTGRPRLAAEVKAALVSIVSHRGAAEKADSLSQEVMHVYHETRDEALLGWLYFNQGFRYGSAGDFRKALELGVRAKEILLKRGTYHVLAMAYHIIAWACYYLGDFENGEEHAGEGLALVEANGINNGSRGWLLLDAALNALGQGRAGEALEAGREGLRYFQELECRWGEAYTLHMLQQAYALKGDLTQAEECGRSALTALSGVELPLEAGYFSACLAELLLETGRPAEAQSLLEHAERCLGSSRFVSRVHLWHARALQVLEQTTAAVRKLLMGLSLCERYGNDSWIVRESPWIVPLMVRAYSLGHMQSYIRSVLQMTGARARKELSLLRNETDPKIRQTANLLLKEIRIEPVGLRVYCLGAFKVYRGEEEIPSSRWKSKKARQLFKILLQARRQRFVPRDVLLEHLWPEEDPEKTTNRLYVALSAVRKTLEPETSGSSYLLRDGDSYRLHLGPDGWVDVDAFRDHIKTAQAEENPDRVVESYLKAVEYYAGDYLEEDLYADWCRQEREALKEEYLCALRTIIGHYEELGDYERSIAYARKYLAKDECAEEIYRNLMRYYALTDNRRMVGKVYEQCKEKLSEELALSLSPETKALYQRLISQ